MIDITGHGFSAVALALIVTGISVWIAWRDVKVSARLMLWIEAVSLFVILVMVVLVLVRHGLHLDPAQLHLTAMTGSGLRLGLVLALFSFVGFESATTLGAEARDPLKTIPRVVIESAVIAGLFFIVSAYSEVLGFNVVGQNLGTSDAPMHVLANVAGVPVLGILIDIGAAVSLLCRDAGLHHGRGARPAAAHVTQWLGARNDFGRRTRATRRPLSQLLLATQGLLRVLRGGDTGLSRDRAAWTSTAGWDPLAHAADSLLTYTLVCAALPELFAQSRSLPSGRADRSFRRLAFLARHALRDGWEFVPDCRKGPYGKLRIHLSCLLKRGTAVVFLEWTKGEQNLNRRMLAMKAGAAQIWNVSAATLVMSC